MGDVRLRRLVAALTAVGVPRPANPVDALGDIQLVKVLCEQLAAHVDGETDETVLEMVALDVLGPAETITWSQVATAPQETRLRLMERLVSSILAEKEIAKRKEAKEPLLQLGVLLSDTVPTVAPSTFLSNVPEIIDSVQTLKAHLSHGMYPPRLLDGQHLTQNQLEMLNEINQMMATEYSVRRKMQLQRLDVTVESFGWQETNAVVPAANTPSSSSSSAIPTRAQRMKAKYFRFRGQLADHVRFELYDALAARTDLALENEQPVSQTRVATSIRDIMLGHVPDRGGRVTAAAKKASVAAAGSTAVSPASASPASTATSAGPSAAPPRDDHDQGRGRGDRGRGRGGRGRGDAHPQQQQHQPSKKLRPSS